MTSLTVPPPYFAAQTIRGTVYDLSHFNPFQFLVESDKVPRPLKVNVRFSTHCFTEGYDPTKHPINEPVIMDEGNRRRAFCSIRHNLSLQLPTLVNNLGAPGSIVYQAASKRNWVYSITLVDQSGSKYQVFFDFRRTAKGLRHLQDLDMFVESAYSVPIVQEEPNILGSVRFALLAGNTYIGKPVNTRKK